jgi:outer membrane protein assembly factor BamA
MQRIVLKQLLFLLFLTSIIILLMGFWIITSAKAETPAVKPFLNDLSWNNWNLDSDEDIDEGFSRRRYHDRSGPSVRYNRVEGLYLGMKLNKDGGRMWYPSKLTIFGFWGYAFSAKEFQYQAGLEKGFFEEYRLAFGGEYHRRITTPDLWIMPEDENSLAAFLIKEDFHDYYFTEGGSGWISQNITSALQLSAAYQVDKTDSLKRRASWSLFGGKKKFRENPAMDAGQFKSLVGRIVIDTRNSVKRTTRGWYIQLEVEHADNHLYDRFLADLRRYQPLGYDEGLDFRIRMGTSYGVLPWQKGFHLGGVSTLRGFEYKEFPNGWCNPGGNRMALVQLEYRMGRENLPDEISFGLLEQFNLIVFTDLGWIGDVDSSDGLVEGFNGLSIRTMKHDVGLGLANRSGSVRIEIARRTDTGHRPYTFSFRISRPF